MVAQKYKQNFKYKDCFQHLDETLLQPVTAWSLQPMNANKCCAFSLKMLCQAFTAAIFGYAVWSVLQLLTESGQTVQPCAFRIYPAASISSSMVNKRQCCSTRGKNSVIIHFSCLTALLGVLVLLSWHCASLLHQIVDLATRAAFAIFLFCFFLAQRRPPSLDFKSCSTSLDLKLKVCNSVTSLSFQNPRWWGTNAKLIQKVLDLTLHGHVKKKLKHFLCRQL